MNDETWDRLEAALEQVDPDGLREAVTDAIAEGVRDELASLGGHLLASVPGQTRVLSAASLPHPLASLGGYLTEHYGDGDATAEV